MIEKFGKSFTMFRCVVTSEKKIDNGETAVVL